MKKVVCKQSYSVLDISTTDAETRSGGVVQGWRLRSVHVLYHHWPGDGRKDSNQSNPDDLTTLHTSCEEKKGPRRRE